MNAKTRTAVFISGRGSNMEALLDAAARDANYPAEFVLVVSDKSDAKGLETAGASGIATVAYERRDFDSKQEHEAAISSALADHAIGFICLAGFMRLLSPQFLDPWAGRIINIHPSLLPRHKGLNTHQRAIDAGDTEHGCSVHFVTAGMDEGPVIAQAKVPVLPDDTADSLAARVLVEEHALYPSALKSVFAELDKE